MTLLMQSSCCLQQLDRHTGYHGSTAPTVHEIAFRLMVLAVNPSRLHSVWLDTHTNYSAKLKWETPKSVGAGLMVGLLNEGNIHHSSWSGIIHDVHTSIPVFRQQVANEAHAQSEACPENDTKANHTPFCLFHRPTYSVTESCSTIPK